MYIVHLKSNRLLGYEMLVSSIGYFKNSADSIRRVENNRNATQAFATKGLSTGYKADGKLGFSDIIKSFTSMFASQSKLRKRALDMIA